MVGGIDLSVDSLFKLKNNCFCTFLSDRLIKSAVPFITISPKDVKLSSPSNVDIGGIVHVVPCA